MTFVQSDWPLNIILYSQGNILLITKNSIAMNPYENNSHTKSTPQNFQTRSHEHTGKIQNWAVQLQQTETLLYSRISKDQREATHRLGENTCKLNIWHEANV